MMKNICATIAGTLISFNVAFPAAAQDTAATEETTAQQHQNLIETARDRIDTFAQTSGHKIYLASRTETPDTQSLLTAFRQKFDNIVLEADINEIFETGYAFWMSSRPGDTTDPDCVLLPGDYKPYNTYADHRGIYHELGDCMQFLITGENDGNMRSQSIADGFATAMHMTDFGRNTGFPEKRAADLQYLSVDQVYLCAKDKCFFDGDVAYDTDTAIKAVMREFTPSIKGRSLTDILTRVTNIVDDALTEKRIAAHYELAESLRDHGLVYRKNHDMQGYTFSAIPQEDRLQILATIRRDYSSNTELTAIIDEYTSQYTQSQNEHRPQP